MLRPLLFTILISIALLRLTIRFEIRLAHSHLVTYLDSSLAFSMTSLFIIALSQHKKFYNFLNLMRQRGIQAPSLPRNPALSHFSIRRRNQPLNQQRNPALLQQVSRLEIQVALPRLNQLLTLQLRKNLTCKAGYRF